MRRGARRFAWFAACLAVLACGDTPSAPEPAPPLSRLWRAPTPRRERVGSAPAASTEVLFEARFDGEQPWWRGRFTDDGGVAFEPAATVDGELELTGGASIGRVHALAVEPGAALRVTLRVRPTAPRTPAAPIDFAALVERRERFDPAHVYAAKEVGAALDPRRTRVHLLQGELGDAAVELETRFVVDSRSRELQLMLLAPVRYARRPFVVESLRVERVSMTAHLAAGGTLPDLEPLDAGLALTLDRDRREGLLLAPGEALRWELPAHARPRRLEFAWGTPPWGAGSAGVAVRVEATPAGSVGATVLADESLVCPTSPAEPAWHDRVLELPASPDGPLALRVSATALDAAAPVLFVAHPTVSLRPAPAVASASPDDATHDADAPADAPPRRPNVLLISLDTLRPDRLGSYGGDPRVSPRLDALAAEGLRFAEASSTSSYTLPSHASMLTGQYPAEHGAVDTVDRIDPTHSPLLAARLAEAGWTTAGFTAGGYVAAWHGFAHGFDRYAENDPVWPHDTLRGAMLHETAAKVGVAVPDALLRRYDAASIVEWLGARRDGPPFFAFVHTYIAHNFAPGAEWLERFDLLRETLPHEAPFDHKERKRFNEGEHALLDEVRAEYLPYYDATIAQADAFVGTLLDALDAAGLAEDTLVIVTSDHGEEFGEHGFFGHGETLYDANTRVPLYARLPGPADARQARVIHDPVSLVDLAPWILRVCGLEPDPRMSGAAELWRLSESPPRRAGLFVELDNHVYRRSAVREGPLKLHVDYMLKREDLPAPALRLFDLVADPAEQHDLAGEPAHADDVARLRERLDAFHAFTEAILPRDGERTDPCDMDPVRREQLRALGYLGDLDCGDR